MIIDDIKNKLFEKSDDPEMLKFNRTFDIKAYLNSFNNIDNVLTFIGKEGINKHLYILSLSKDDKTISLFDGELITIKIDSSEIFLKKCPLNHANSEIIQKHFDFTRPVTIGLTNSFGFGDRLGLANAGHIRSLRGYKFKPIFAQQSIRELTRTNRTAENVIDAAVWAVLQEGYKDGYGADADHLKTKADVDMMVKTGYRTFTIDPSDHIVNGVENITPVKLSKDVANLPWETYGF
ncbi:MAG: tagaturonate epimerase family protein, partial [Ignavibacteriaceae bacterium]|nr:tagaturonate epimerase family protein [Ignavibacteriaceae bacterium]